MIQILIKVKFNLKHLMGKTYSLLTEIIDLLFREKNKKKKIQRLKKDKNQIRQS